MQDIYKAFEFDIIREKILEHSRSEIAKERIANLEMFKDFSLLKNELEFLKEIMSITSRFGPFPLSNSANALFLIDLAKKTSMLTPKDLNMIAEDVATSQKIIKFFKKIDNSYPLTQEKITAFFDLTNLEKEIRRVITNSLSIADNASETLYSIRQKIKKAEAQLATLVMSLSLTYSSYLNGENATIREGHYVLPVKTKEKSKVQGIIYDISDSGSTTFIEPMEIVNLNNNLTQLKIEENEEIRKILKALTALVIIQEGEIISNNKIIADLDFASSKSEYAYEINAEVSEISDERMILLKDARHPLIDPKKVVSNSYFLTNDNYIDVISGPNAGGKTVSLKTVGLLVLMHQAGLAIPASKAKLSFFNNIRIDIGDNQSLSDNLSTFSAHMSNIGEICEKVKKDDLVLLDELGTGTSPKEGEAIALSVLKYLEQKKCFAMISSHFAALKEYALTSKNISNSSMIFDEEKLLPTYVYKTGVPGHSYALSVAKRFGLKESILEDAAKYLSENSSNDSGVLLEKLENKMAEVTKLEALLTKQRNELETKEKQLENSEKLLEEKRKNLLSSVEEQKEEILAEAMKEVDEILDSLKQGDIKPHQATKAKKDLENLKEDKNMTTFNEEISVDDFVLVPSLNISGVVTRINGNKAYILSDEGIAFDVDKTKLQKLIKPKNSKKKVIKVAYDKPINTSLSMELNIIGLRSEEAKDKLINYIADCRMRHLTPVRIIHGFGAGILRKMVHAYLDTQKDITYRPGNMHEGGGGATVVYFDEGKN